MPTAPLPDLVLAVTISPIAWISFYRAKGMPNSLSHFNTGKMPTEEGFVEAMTMGSNTAHILTVTLVLFCEPFVTVLLDHVDS